MLCNNIYLEKNLLISKYFNKPLPTILKNWFTLLTYFTCLQYMGVQASVDLLPYCNKLYGKIYVNISAKREKRIYQLSPTKLKCTINKFI